MKLEVLNDFVLAKVFKRKERKAGAVFVPEKAKDDRGVFPAKVTGVGPMVRFKMTSPIKVGDIIAVRIIDAQRFGVGDFAIDNQIVVMPCDRVLCRISDISPDEGWVLGDDA